MTHDTYHARLSQASPSSDESEPQHRRFPMLITGEHHKARRRLVGAEPTERKIFADEQTDLATFLRARTTPSPSIPFRETSCKCDNPGSRMATTSVHSLGREDGSLGRSLPFKDPPDPLLPKKSRHWRPRGTKCHSQQRFWPIGHVASFDRVSSKSSTGKRTPPLTHEKSDNRMRR